MRELPFNKKPALSGKTNSLLVFLHGYGADGADLFGLADVLAPHLPDTVFLAPDAPERARGGHGLQWFPIPWLDGSSEAAARDGLARASEDLNGFLDTRLANAVSAKPSSASRVSIRSCRLPTWPMRARC